MAETEHTLLSTPEGVLLGHALVSRVAQTLGVRAFFIKGPATVMQGLRQSKTSADVDVFVDPAGLQVMHRGLRERGWRERPMDPDIKSFPKHAITLNHPEWPCCIDVHFRFPGMELSDNEGFEAMWANTEVVDLAGQEVLVPSKQLGILILALHALRAPGVPACRQELESLAAITTRQSHAIAIHEIAKATKSLAAVRPFLENLLPRSVAVEWLEPSREWRNRILAKEPGSARLLAISQAAWRDRPGLLWRAAFARPEVFLSGNIYADISMRGRLALHTARWARFLRAAPRIVRDFASARRTC